MSILFPMETTTEKSNERITGDVVASNYMNQETFQQRQFRKQPRKLKKQKIKAVYTPFSDPLFLIIIIFGSILIVLLLVAFITYAPFLCLVWMAIMYVVWLYLSTDWWWHDAQEFENRFWTVTAFVFSTAVLYIQDSPIAIGQWNATVGMLLVFIFTTFVHYLDRRIHRLEISRRPRLNIQAFMTSQKSYQYKAPAEEKAKLVIECLDRIDGMYLPSTISNFINLPRVQQSEQKIFRIFAGASKDELNYIIGHVPLALLFYKVKDHSKVPSDQSRTLILDLLCTKRLADLTVTSRAILLDALMVMKISAHPYAEKWVRNIFLRTSEDELSRLKSLTDAKGDFHSLHKLIYNDIKNSSIRQDILRHIQQQADVQKAHMRLGTKRARQRKEMAWRKVLSDVDDTLYSSGGKYFAGVDERYPRHALYPGVLSFYRELDMGTVGTDEWSKDRVGNLVFLSARPHVYKDLAERKSYFKFKGYEEKGMHTVATMLAGSLKSGHAFVVQGNLEPMAQKKFENFCEYYTLYPEFKHIFVGDNGQGDVRAAELIVGRFGINNALEAGFFHIVKPLEQTFGYHSPDDIERWRNMGIVFFHTYVGAAVEAYKMQKIRLGGLRKIANTAVVNFEEIQSWVRSDDREAARQRLNEDIMLANELLGVDAVRLILKPQKFEVGSTVRTPFGRGAIRKYSGVDGIYKVELTDWPTGDQGSNAIITRKSNVRPRKRAYGYFSESSLMTFVSGDSKAQEKFSKSKSNLRYLRFYKPAEKNVFLPRSTVQTPFGAGKVVKYRPDDEVLEISFDFTIPMMGYFTPDSVEPIDPPNMKSSTVPRSPMFSTVRSFFSKRLRLNESESKQFASGTKIITPYGNGVIEHYADDICTISLVDWTLASGKHAIIYMNKENVSLPLTISTAPRSLSSVPTLSLVSSPVSESGERRARFHERPSSSGILHFFNVFQSQAEESKSMLRISTPFGIGLTSQSDTKDSNGVWTVSYDDMSNLVGVTAYIQNTEASLISDEELQTKRTTLDIFGNPFNYLRGSWVAPTDHHETDTDTKIRKYYIGRHVMTPMGEGFIATYRSKDEICVVNLRSSMTGYFHVHSIHNVVHGIVGKPVHTKHFGTGLLEEVREYDGVHVVSIRNDLYVTEASSFSPASSTSSFKRNQSSLQFSSMEISCYLQPSWVLGQAKASRGDYVQTPYGSGVILSYRHEDDMYCVALHWGTSVLHSHRKNSQSSYIMAYLRSDMITRDGIVEKLTPTSCSIM